MNKIAKIVQRAEIGYLNNIKSLKSLSNLLSKKIELKRIELNKLKREFYQDFQKINLI